LDWDKDLPVAQLSDRCFKATEGVESNNPNLPPHPTDQLNTLLPPQFHLATLRTFNIHDWNLYHRLLKEMRYSDPIVDRDQLTRLQLCHEHLRALDRELIDLQTAPLLFPQDDTGSFRHENVIFTCWQRYRGVLKDLAGIGGILNYFSPTYGAAGHYQRGPDQVCESMVNDYQRWGMPALDTLESDLEITQFGTANDGTNSQTLLFNSGTAALAGILGLLENNFTTPNRDDVPPKIFRVGNIYFEIDDVIKRFCNVNRIKPCLLDPKDTEGVVQQIKRELPDAVFLSPVSNDFDATVTEVTRILEGLADPRWAGSVDEVFFTFDDIPRRKLYLVIDNTTTGRSAKWPRFDFPSLPRFVTVVSFESLLKYGEDGLDLASAGTVTLIGEHDKNELRMLRRRSGAVPSEHTVLSLMNAYDRDDIVRQMERRSRNASYLAERLSRSFVSESFLSQVSHPGTGDRATAERLGRECTGVGGILRFSFNFDFLLDYRERRRKADYEYMDGPIDRGSRSGIASDLVVAFSRLAVILAQSVNVELNRGGSFGFNYSRIGALDRIPMAAEEKEFSYLGIPYLRMAVGTENIRDIAKLATVFQRTNEIFTEAKERGNLIQLVDLLKRNSLSLVA